MAAYTFVCDAPKEDVREALLHAVDTIEFVQPDYYQSETPADDAAAQTIRILNKIIASLAG